MNRLYSIAFQRILKTLNTQKLNLNNIHDILSKNNVRQVDLFLVYRLSKKETHKFLRNPCPVTKTQDSKSNLIIEASKRIQVLFNIDIKKVCSQCPFKDSCPKFQRKPQHKLINGMEDLLIFMNAMNDKSLIENDLSFDDWKNGYASCDTVIQILRDFKDGGKQYVELEKVRLELSQEKTQKFSNQGDLQNEHSTQKELKKEKEFKKEKDPKIKEIRDENQNQVDLANIFDQQQKFVSKQGKNKIKKQSTDNAWQEKENNTFQYSDLRKNNSHQFSWNQGTTDPSRNFQGSNIQRRQNSDNNFHHQNYARREGRQSFNQNFSQRGQNQYHPRSHNEYHPRSHNEYHPRSHNEYHPRRHNQYHPRSHNQYNPRWNNQYNPRWNNQYHPRRQNQRRSYSYNQRSQNQFNPRRQNQFNPRSQSGDYQRRYDFSYQPFYKQRNPEFNINDDFYMERKNRRNQSFNRNYEQRNHQQGNQRRNNDYTNDKFNRMRQERQNKRDLGQRRQSEGRNHPNDNKYHSQQLLFDPKIKSKRLSGNKNDNSQQLKSDQQMGKSRLIVGNKELYTFKFDNIDNNEEKNEEEEINKSEKKIKKQRKAKKTKVDQNIYEEINKIIEPPQQQQAQTVGKKGRKIKSNL